MKKAVEAPLLGHPDKVCDFLVESIVDEYLRRDPFSRLDIQALGTHGMVMVGGVVESQADFAVIDVVRDAYHTIGYDDAPDFFVNVEKPRPEPGRTKKHEGAQGTAILYGYATNKTREMLPPAVVYAHALAARIDELRLCDARFSWLRPDGKVQVMMDGDRVTHVVIIASHQPDMDTHHVQQLLFAHVLEYVLGSTEGIQLFINPVGVFTTGGFSLNAGVSGRKVLADLYGGLLPHGGVSLVGKDPLKPARAGTYMARFVAKQLVREGVAEQILVQVVYTAGLVAPVYVQAVTGDGKDVTELLVARFDFRPEAIVERFHLRRPFYAGLLRTGCVGTSALPWEAIV
jgi:S-adenosylmethionine synthetase